MTKSLKQIYTNENIHMHTSSQNIEDCFELIIYTALKSPRYGREDQIQPGACGMVTSACLKLQPRWESK